ncbi:MAG: hypothetical protein WBO70_07130 [Erysipelotrichaceae bacterium]
MKKLITIMMALLVMLSITGCGGKSNGSNIKASISVQVEKPWMPYYEAVKERVLAKNPDAEIKFIEVGSFDMLDTLDKTDPTNPDIADVFSMPADRLYGLVDNNAIAAIDAETMAKEVGGFKDFKAGLGGNLKVGEDYFAFPYNIETLLLYVNKANAAAAGVDLTKSFEFNSQKFGEMIVAVHDAWFGVAFANSAEFELLKKDGKELKTDAIKNYSDLSEKQKGLFDSLYNYWKENAKNKTALWDKDAWGGYAEGEFVKEGGAIFRIDGPWATVGIQEKIGADNVVALPLTQVTVNGNALNQWKGGWGLAINSRIEEKANESALAKEFIKEVVNPKYAQDLFKATGKIIENVEPSAYKGIGGINEEVINATYKSYEQAVNRPLFKEYGNVWPTWQNALLSWSAQQPANSEEAYKIVKSSFEAMMATIKK